MVYDIRRTVYPTYWWWSCRLYYLGAANVLTERSLRAVAEVRRGSERTTRIAYPSRIMRHLLHATSLSTSAYHTLALTTTAGTQNCHHSFRKLSRTLTTNITLSTMAPIERITLFNIPKEEDRLRLVEEYKQLVRDALKVNQSA